MLKVYFNNQELTKYITVLKGFTAFDGAEYKPSITEYPTLNGEIFNYTKRGAKKITMPFYVKYRNVEDYDKLQSILNVKKPEPLIFSHIPDREFYAIPSGNLEFEEIRFNGKGKITWIIPDGYAISRVARPTSASISSNGELKATVSNRGTLECPINYRIKFNDDGGYLGIVSEKGIIQVGSKSANYTNADPELRKLVIADDAINDTFNANWTKGGGYPSSPFPTTSSWGRISKDGRWFMYPKGYGSGSSYHGASMWRKFSPDSSGTVGSKDFEVEGRLFFLNSNGKEQGLQEVIISDANGNNKIGFSVNKPSDGNQAKIQLYNGETSAHIDIDTGANKYVDWKTGTFKIKKVGRDVTFSFNARANINYHVTTIDNVVFDTVTLYGAQIANRPTMARLWFEYLRVWRLKNTEDKKAPVNVFSSGDELFIDGESGKIYHNGVLISDVNGSEWFDADIGQTDIVFYYSNYSSKPPTVTCEVKERWI